MTLHSALTNPALKRFVALTAVYVLALQALFGSGAQLRVLLSDAPGLCTILGFQQPEQPKHAMDACAAHCIGHASLDLGGLAATVATILALAASPPLQVRRSIASPRPALAFLGRGPPR